MGVERGFRGLQRPHVGRGFLALFWAGGGQLGGSLPHRLGCLEEGKRHSSILERRESDSCDEHTTHSYRSEPAVKF